MRMIYNTVQLYSKTNQHANIALQFIHIGIHYSRDNDKMRLRTKE